MGETASPFASPGRIKRLLANSASVPPETDKALIGLLNGPERHLRRKHRTRLYNRNPAAFGEPGSKLRGQVKTRREYLESIQDSDPDRFFLCYQALEAGEPTPPWLVPESSTRSEFSTPSVPSVSDKEMSARKKTPPRMNAAVARRMAEVDDDSVEDDDDESTGSSLFEAGRISETRVVKKELDLLKSSSSNDFWIFVYREYEVSKGTQQLLTTKVVLECPAIILSKTSHLDYELHLHKDGRGVDFFYPRVPKLDPKSIASMVKQVVKALLSSPGKFPKDIRERTHKQYASVFADLRKDTKNRIVKVSYRFKGNLQCSPEYFNKDPKELKLDRELTTFKTDLGTDKDGNKMEHTTFFVHWCLSVVQETKALYEGSESDDALTRAFKNNRLEDSGSSDDELDEDDTEDGNEDGGEGGDPLLVFLREAQRKNELKRQARLDFRRQRKGIFAQLLEVVAARTNASSQKEAELSRAASLQEDLKREGEALEAVQKARLLEEEALATVRSLHQQQAIAITTNEAVMRKAQCALMETHDACRHGEAALAELNAAMEARQLEAARMAASEEEVAQRRGKELAELTAAVEFRKREAARIAAAEEEDALRRAASVKEAQEREKAALAVVIYQRQHEELKLAAVAERRQGEEDRQRQQCAAVNKETKRQREIERRQREVDRHLILGRLKADREARKAEAAARKAQAAARMAEQASSSANASREMVQYTQTQAIVPFSIGTGCFAIGKGADGIVTLPFPKSCSVHSERKCESGKDQEIVPTTGLPSVNRKRCVSEVERYTSGDVNAVTAGRGQLMPVSHVPSAQPMTKRLRKDCSPLPSADEVALYLGGKSEPLDVD